MTSLYFIPLGGAGEIGMNFNLYGYEDRWLIVDLGVGFFPGDLDGVILPDHSFISQRRHLLDGIVLTHAHEDHLGAIAHLWPALRCPVYATPFTASVLRSRLAQHGLAQQVPIHEIALKSRFRVGSFDLETIPITHSIPESVLIVLRTRYGTVVHTGDWRFDSHPLIGAATDYDRLAQLGAEGVLAVIGDSTNALEDSCPGSEESLRDNLVRLFQRFRFRIVVTCFASNVARLRSVAQAAAHNGRQVALVGRSLWRIHDAADIHGYFADLEPFLTSDEIEHLPRKDCVLICTGSQGEKLSAISRLAADRHQHLSLHSGDVVLFSSSEIPGNEEAIARVQRTLTRRGIGVIAHQQEFIHVSGHPGRQDLYQMYRLLRPRLLFPVHGEPAHQQSHANLGQSCDVPSCPIPRNGDIIRFSMGQAEITESLTTQPKAVHGRHAVPLPPGWHHSPLCTTRGERKQNKRR